MCVILWHSSGRQNWLGRLHFLGPVLADGTLGVRIFFVISGFLITTLLLSEFDRKGNISIRGFYERRIARIFPAFYLYIGIIVALMLFGVISVDRSVIYAACTFTWNFIHFWRHAVHPDDSVLLGHFWTLSVEEQFYIVWPSCLVFLGLRRSMRLALAGVILLPLLRFCAFWWLPEGGLRVAIESHVVQDLILIGVLAAFAVRAEALDRFRQNRFRASFPWISAITLFVVCPGLLSMQKFGFGAYVVPSLQGLSTVLLIFWLLSGEGGFFRWLLETWPVVQVGLLSYSLYIWQQPILQWERLNWIRFPWTVLAPLPVAVLCYQCWELPMRKRIRAWFHQSAKVHSE